METSIEVLHARIKKLERSNRNMRLCGVAAVVAAVAVFISLQLHPKIIEVERISVRSKSRESPGELVLRADNGPAVELYDGNHTLRLNMSLDHGAPNLTLRNNDGLGVAVLADVSTGPGLVLADRSGNLRAQLDVGENGPRLYLEDEKGFSATVGSYWSGDPIQDSKLRAASVILSQKSLGVLWHAP